MKNKPAYFRDEEFVRKRQRMCEHRIFHAHVEVNRLSDIEDGPITHYAADITIQCSDCDQPFEFLGLPGGLDPHRPMVSADKLEARMPIAPMFKKVDAPYSGLITMPDIVQALGGYLYDANYADWRIGDTIVWFDDWKGGSWPIENIAEGYISFASNNITGMGNLLRKRKVDG